MEAILVPLIFFVFLGAVIIVPMWLAHQGRIAKMDLVRHAIDKGQAIDPSMLQSLYETEREKKRPDQARRSLGSAVILIALAAGLGVAAYMSGETHNSDGMYTAAAIVGCLGAGFLILAIVDYATKKNDVSKD